jgi:phenol 2-monooxygenase (NADPH)
MQSMGVTVDRPVYPTSLELSKDEAELKVPNSHPIKVRLSPIRALLNQTSLCYMSGSFAAGWFDRHRNRPR